MNMLYDKDIRDPLFDYLEEQFGKIRVIDEKQLGSNTRADMFMVTESEFIGIEIKSDADTYIRLASQIKGYDAYCDRNYIVAGSRHGKHVAEHVPSYWGIILVERRGEEVCFFEIRQAVSNPKCNPKLQFSLLWRRELDHILKRFRLPKYKQKSRSYIVERIFSKMEYKQLKKQACEELFQRDYSEI